MSFFLSPCILSGRSDATSGKVNFRPDMRHIFFLKKKKKKIRTHEFMWLLKQFGATAP